MLRKLISILLAVSFVFGFTVFAEAEESYNTKLYTIYADGMLFQQNKESTLAGTGKPGDKITAELYHGKKLVTSGESTVGTDGKFTVSFTAPKGSYTQYLIMLKENDEYIKTLKNIVFGELWLASGQSNMMYPLAQSVTGIEMFEKQEKLSPWLRVLLVPGYPEYKGETALTRLPLEAQEDITDAEWVTGEDFNVYNVSAVAYFFAVELMKKLDMPVGPFVTDGSYMTKTWCDLPWTECDDKQTWFNNNNDPYGGYYDSWKSENAELTFSGDFMNVKGSGNFDVSPTISYEIDGKKTFHQDSQRDFSDYGKLTFSVRNNGEKNVTFDSFRIYRETFMWYSPEANGSHDSSFVIPADGEWHKVTLDLNALYLYANECGIISPNNMIKYIQDMKFCFASEGEADIDLDNFRFAPEEEDTSFFFETKLSDADNVWEFISAMFSGILGIIFKR